jgi:hypothetical protein
MNRIIKVWRKMMTFANPGMLLQTDTSFSSRLVILPDPKESKPTLKLI